MSKFASDLLEEGIRLHASARAARLAVRTVKPDDTSLQISPTTRVGDLPTLHPLSHRQVQNQKRHFLAKPRFLLKSLTSREALESSTLESPRPVDYMMEFRSSPEVNTSGQSRHATASDQAILEILISASREQSAHHEYKYASLPVFQLCLLAGPTATSTSVRKSLSRLRLAKFRLPGLIIPKKRISYEKRLKAQQAIEGSLDIYELAYLDLQHLINPGLQQISAIPEEFLSFPPVPSRNDRNPHSILTPQAQFLRDAPVDSDEWRSLPALEDKIFSPVFHFQIIDGVVYFELNSYLRYYINEFRLVGQKRQKYCYLSHDVMSSLRSPYSPGIYRFLASQAFDEKTGKPLIGIKYVNLSFEKLAQMVGYSRQRGGFISQIRRNIVDRIAADLIGKDCKNFVVSNIEVGLTDVHFELSSKIDLPKMGSKLFWNWEATTDGSAFSVKPLTSAERRKIAPADIDIFFLSLGIIAKIRQRFDLSKQECADFSDAWRLAIDEALNSDSTRYGCLTDDSSRRQVRGLRLLELIAVEGPSSAAITFAAEEYQSKDLTNVETLARLRADGTLYFANCDRELRLKATLTGSKSHFRKVFRIPNEHEIEASITTARKINEESVFLQKYGKLHDAELRKEFFSNRRKSRAAPASQ